MPFPNEHAARQADPKSFDSFRRDASPKGAPKGVSFIYGIKDGKSKIQSIRFDRKQWTPERAKTWLKEHGFKTAGFEAAGKAGPVKKGFWSGLL